MFRPTSFIIKNWNLCRRNSSSLAEMFHRDGFIQQYEVMPPSEMERLRQKFDGLEASRENKKFISQEINLHFTHRFIYDLCVHPAALDVVRDLLASDDVVLLSSAIFSKYAPEKTSSTYSGDFVGWHQDLRYWGLESVQPGQPVQIVNMWLAVDQADESNGAMQFLRGSHNRGYFEHVQSSREGNQLNENQDMVIPTEMADQVVQSTLLPGQASFHDGKILDLTLTECHSYLGMVVHGSKASLSRRRLGMTAQFTRTNVRMNKMSYTQSRAFSEDFRKPVLVAGQDHFGELRYHKSKEQILRETS